MLDNPGDLRRSPLDRLTAPTAAKVMLFPVRFITRNMAAKQSGELYSVFNNRLTLNKPNWVSDRPSAIVQKPVSIPPTERESIQQFIVWAGKTTGLFGAYLRKKTAPEPL